MRQWSGFSQACCFVTFDSYSDDRRLNRTGFGEQFLGDNAIDAIHIVAAENDWYQYHDFLDVCARIRELTAGYDRVISYGSSMGGYAAIRFGRAVGADLAFALSPQFSIDPVQVPFENRWLQDSKRVAFLHEADPPAFVETAIIVYDKHNPDARHVDLFRPHTIVLDVALLDCGHPSTGFLAELHLLQRGSLSLAKGVFDPAAFQHEARRRRKEAGQFYFTLSRRSRLPARRLALAQQAVAHGPGNISYLANLATIAAANGNLAIAQDALARGAQIAPRHPVLRYHHSEVLEMAGDLDGAIEIMEEMASDFLASGVYQHRLDFLRAKIDERDRKTWHLPASQVSEGGRHDGISASPLPEASLTTQGFNILGHRLIERFAHRLARGRAAPNSRRLPLPTIERLRPELRVTTYPAPPPFATSWERHDTLIRRAPRGPVDLFMVGDSLTKDWPDSEWAPWRLFNFGVAADKTQHVIWRLDEVTRRLIATRTLIMIGTNNLGAGDTPAGIVAGITAILRSLNLVAPTTNVVIVEVPPCGPNLDFRDADRKAANRMLREANVARTVNVDTALTSPDSNANPYYMPDHIHFSSEGYRLLTELLRKSWD